ncbi:hypothetical protein cyc_06878 [Cyclospora cayetanensis]|uniref:Uncharacterized protein n=1 Tax=Cyclospora cayetanensis TaxID=88456 RepID=A0A1D3D2F6_9EIME|nr:hypothetical protein cyc_06878 [Cyclospora cayetanensis]
MSAPFWQKHAKLSSILSAVSRSSSDVDHRTERTTAESGYSTPQQPALEERHTDKMGIATLLTTWGFASPDCVAAFRIFSFPAPCLLGVCLNYMILVGGLGVRLPQLYRVWKAKSVVGISEASVLVEALGAWLFVAYNLLQGHAFTTWGEVLFIGIQNLCLVSLYWKYSRGNAGKRRRCLRWAAAIAAALGSCYLQILPARACEAITNLLGVSPLPLMILARMPQIVQNYEQGHTGQLSLVSLSMTLLGGLARLATVLQQVPDGYILASSALAVVLNLLPTLQVGCSGRRHTMSDNNTSRSDNNTEGAVLLVSMRLLRLPFIGSILRRCCEEMQKSENAKQPRSAPLWLLALGTAGRHSKPRASCRSRRATAPRQTPEQHHKSAAILREIRDTLRNGSRSQKIRSRDAEAVRLSCNARRGSRGPCEGGTVCSAALQQETLTNRLFLPYCLPVLAAAVAAVSLVLPGDGNASPQKRGAPPRKTLRRQTRFPGDILALAGLVAAAEKSPRAPAEESMGFLKEGSQLQGGGGEVLWVTYESTAVATPSAEKLTNSTRKKDPMLPALRFTSVSSERRPLGAAPSPPKEAPRFVMKGEEQSLILPQLIRKPWGEALSQKALLSVSSPPPLFLSLRNLVHPCCSSRSLGVLFSFALEGVGDGYLPGYRGTVKNWIAFEDALLEVLTAPDSAMHPSTAGGQFLWCESSLRSPDHFSRLGEICFELLDAEKFLSVDKDTLSALAICGSLLPPSVVPAECGESNASNSSTRWNSSALRVLRCMQHFTGLVIDMGASLTRVSPILSGQTLGCLAVELPLGGRDIDAFLCGSLLRQQQQMLKAPTERPCDCSMVAHCS